jgi:hypothetical protein
VTGNVSASAAVDTSAQPTVVLKSLPTQSKFSKKNKKGDNVATFSLPASATTSTALLPSAPKSLPAEKEREQIIWLAKVLKAASPPPVVDAPKEAGTALAPSSLDVSVRKLDIGATKGEVATALDPLHERNTSLDFDDSSSDSVKSENSSSDSLSLGSSSDDDSLSSSSQPAMVTGTSIVNSGTAIVNAAELIAAVSAATSMAALSLTNPLIEAVAKEVFAKELGWIPEKVLKPMEEEEVEVYGPGSSSSDSCNQSSVKEEQSVQHLDIVSASAHEVSNDTSCIVIVQVSFFILILISDLKCIL